MDNYKALSLKGILHYITKNDIVILKISGGFYSVGTKIINDSYTFKYI